MHLKAQPSGQGTIPVSLVIVHIITTDPRSSTISSIHTQHDGVISSQHPQSALYENRATSLTLRKDTKTLSQSQMNTKFPRDVNSNCTNHSHLTHLLGENFRRSLTNILERLPRMLLYFETNPVDQHYQRRSSAATRTIPAIWNFP